MPDDTRLCAVVCDNNGTLFDDLETVAYPSAVAIFRAFGAPAPPLAVYRNEITSDFAEFYWRHGVPRSVSPEEMNEYRRLYYEEHGHEAQYRPDVERFLRSCQEYDVTLSIVSAEIESTLDGQLNLAGIREYFDDIHAQAWPKTPAFVETLIRLSLFRRTPIYPALAVYIDDTYEGLAAAKSIGMRTIGFTNPTAYCSEDRIREAKPDDVAKDFKEVRRIVRKWSR